MYVPGVLPLLTSVLQSGVDDERKAAADTLAELAKDPENVKVFKVRARTVVFSPCNPFDDHCWTAEARHVNTPCVTAAHT